MKYRPANGSEGLDFIDAWCGRCERDEDYRNGGDSCPIVANGLAYELYPMEWVYGPQGPLCSAFTPIGADLELEAAAADPRQLALF